MNSHCTLNTLKRLILIKIIGLIPMISAKVLPDPVIGERCEEMANRRKEKYQYKQRLYELIIKNQTLRRETPPQKEKLLAQLYKIHNDLNQRRHLIEAQIQNLEEEIIRKGCPGVPVGDLKIDAPSELTMDRATVAPTSTDERPPVVTAPDEKSPIPETPAEMPSNSEDILKEEESKKNDAGTTP